MAHIKSIDEKVLLENCLLHKEWAQKELYDLYSSQLFAICSRYATDSSEAKDILQESFIKIFTHLKQYNGSGSLIVWMKRVTVNTALNYIKKHRKEITKEFDYANENMIGEIDSTTSYIDAKEIIKAFMQLSYAYRTILGLHIIEGYNHKEISELLLIEEVTCRTRVHRAKEKLKKIIAFENNAIATKDI